MRTFDFTDAPVTQRGHRHFGRGPETAIGSRIDYPEAKVRHGVCLHNAFHCQTCDAFPSFDVADDAEAPDGFRLVARTECSLPDGMTVVSSLEVPSGRLVIADDLRPIFDVPLVYSVNVPSYNSLAGQAHHIARMATAGCAYGPLGSVGATFVEHTPGRYAIVTRDEGETEPDAARPLASICTDLWAFSIADHDHWVSLGGAPDRHLGGVEIITVPVGTYVITQRLDPVAPDDRPWPIQHATFELIDATETP